MPLRIDVSSLEGWFVKKRGPNKHKVLSILSSDTKRWFKVKELVSYNRLEMALCYYKSELDIEPRGWMYMRDIVDLRDNGDTITIVSLARSITIEAKSRAVHEYWFKCVSSLCPSLRNAEGQEKLHILANERYRGRKGSTALTASSAIRATNEEKGISNTNHPYRRENTVAEGKESAITSISDSPRSTRGATFKRNNDHQEYVPDEFLNLDYNGDRGSGKGHRQSIESSSSRPRISSSSSIYDRNDQLAFELPKSRPKSSTTPLRIDTVKSADSAQFDDAPHGLLVRSAGSDYDDDTETLNMSYGSSKCRRSRSTDYRAKDTKQIVENSSSHPRNHPPSGSAASTFFNSDCDSPTDIIEDVGEPQEYCPRPLPRKKESDMSRLGKVTDDRHRAGVKQSSKIDATISEKAEIKASFSRDRPPLCPPGSALNPYLAPDKIPSASRMGNAEPKKTDIDSTYHDWDEEDDRRDLDYFTEVERRSRVNNQKKESESDREDSQSRISGGVDADTNWLTTNFDEE